MAAHNRAVMATGGGQGPGELQFKHPIFLQLYEATKLAVDGHEARFDDDDDLKNVAVNGQKAIIESVTLEPVTIEQEIEMDFTGAEYLNALDDEETSIDLTPFCQESTSAEITHSTPVCRPLQTENEVPAKQIGKQQWNKYSAVMLRKPKHSALQSRPNRAIKTLPVDDDDIDVSRTELRDAKLELVRNEIAMAKESHALAIAERKQRMENENEEHRICMQILRADLSTKNRRSATSTDNTVRSDIEEN